MTEKSITSEIVLQKDGDKLFLMIGNTGLLIDDYKISSSAQEGTELDIKIRCKEAIMEFALSATRE